MTTEKDETPEEYNNKTEWNEKKENKALRRYRFFLTLRIIRVALISFLIFSAYVSVLTIGYAQSMKGEKLNAYSQLAVDWVYPGLSSEFSIQSPEISPLLTQKTSIPIYRKIGKEERSVGHFQVKKTIFPYMTNASFQFYQKNYQPRFNFWLPIHPETGVKLDANEHPRVWETLEKVHEGTVADLAFSTKTYFTPEDIFLLLADYDIDINWMPVYMGELDEFSEGWLGGNNSVSVGPWGLTHASEYNNDYRMDSRAFLAKENLERNKQLMLTNMKRIYNDDPKLAKAIFSTRFFEERIQFLEENGFIVYGAVVTGPTKELLKLKELEEIQGVQIGEITFWNW